MEINQEKLSLCDPHLSDMTVKEEDIFATLYHELHTYINNNCRINRV